MNNFLVKFDRVTSITEALELQDLGVDLIGVSLKKNVSFSDDRYVDREVAILIRRELQKSKFIGEIVVEENFLNTISLIYDIGFDYVQLSENQLPPVEFIQELKSICKKCGSPMEIKQEGSTQGLFCTNCDWSIVTTYIPEILLDEALYEVSIINGDAQNKQHIKTVSEIANVNFLAARKLLQEQSPLIVFRGDAKEVVRVRELLSMAGLVYEITPEFPWSEDQILELKSYYHP